MYCKSCKKEIDNDTKFCKYCGDKQQLTDEIKKIDCRGCGKEIDSSAEFCEHCGYSQKKINNDTEKVKIKNDVNNKLFTCEDCEKEYSIKLKICPDCGAERELFESEKAGIFGALFWVLVSMGTAYLGGYNHQGINVLVMTVAYLSILFLFLIGRKKMTLASKIFFISSSTTIYIFSLWNGANGFIY